MILMTGAFVFLLILLQADLCHFQGTRIFFPDEIIKQPDIPRSDYSCGYPYTNTIHYAELSNGVGEVHIYHINKTADKLKSEGFQINVLDMFGDAISNMTFTNGSYTGNIAFVYYFAVAPAGGEPAELERAQYMAQLGVKNGDEIQFLCDGVLINRQWVLTAAHCFVGLGFDLNYLRLGDYDITKPVASNDVVHGKRVENYVIQDVIFHPEYNPKERYNDLALIPLPRKTPEFAPSINPICLPWKYINENLQDREVVLTGWGATKYGGRKTPLLQQVKLKVFNASVCQKSYSKLPKFYEKHPEGLTDDNILCVGWNEDGKDACNGDSGAPIVFGRNGDIRGDFILAGIVSGGFGCGLKQYPGLYIPINKPKYLRWIKEVAFKDYE